MLEQVILRAVLPNAKEFLEPVQLGVGVKDATAHIAVAISRVLPKVLASPLLGILQVDISNVQYGEPNKYNPPGAAARS